MKLENLKEFELTKPDFSIIYGGTASLMTVRSEKKDISCDTGDSYKRDKS